MAKEKKISINALENVMKSGEPNVAVYKWNDIDVSVKKRLGLREMMEFVETVKYSCFQGDEAEYTPEAKDFAIRCCTVTMYANFSLPENLEKRYDLVYCTDAYDFVCERIDWHQYTQIIEAINRKVNHIASMGIQGMLKRFGDVADAISGIKDSMAGMLDGVEPGDIQKIASAFNSGEFDEKKLMQAWLENKDGGDDA